MNSLAPASLHILYLTGSPDDEQVLQAEFEKADLNAYVQKVDNESDFRSALANGTDLVIFNDNLPGLPTLHALQTVRQQKVGIPFLFLTADKNEDKALEALQLGADEALTRSQFSRLGFTIKRLLAQKRLRESEQLYRGIFENARVAIWDEDFSQVQAEIDKLRVQGVHDFARYIKEHPQFVQQLLKLVKILDVNEATLQLYDIREKAEVLGSLENFVTPENFQDELIAFAAGKRYFEREIRETNNRGLPLDLLMTITYYEDNVGGSKALVHLSDITDRKLVEQAVRESESRYRTLVEKIPAIVYISNPKQHIGVTYISPRIESLGFTADEWTADPELWVQQLHPDDRDRVLDEIEHTEQSDQPFQTEYRLFARDGSVRWFLDEVMDIPDAEGKPLFRQGFMLDITQRKEAEALLSARERYLELLNEMTRAILLSGDYDMTMRSIATYMREIIKADDCYIAGWNDETKLAVAITTTAKLDFAFEDAPKYPEEVGIVASILRIGHVIAIDDVYNSPYINVEAVRDYPAKSIIGIPLLVKDQKLGAVIVAFNSYHSFTQEDIDRSAQAGNQVALALWNHKQSAEIQQKLKENDALARIERALGESERVGTGEVLQLIVDAARELMPHAEKSVIHLLAEEEQILFAHAVSGYDDREPEHSGTRMRLGEGIAGQVMSEGITINIGDITTHPKFFPTQSAPNFRSLLVSPVLSGSHHIGTISIQSSKPYAFTGNDAELLKTLAIQAAVALENTRLFETTQQRLKEVNILYHISRALALSLDADQLIQDMITLLQQIFDYYYVQFYLIDQNTQNLVIKHGSGPIGRELVQIGHYLLPGEGIVGHVAETSEAFLTNNVEEIVFFKRNPSLPDTQYEIAVPIKIDGQVIGVLDIQQTPPRRFSENDLNLMTAIADHFAIVLQKANLYSTLQTALQQEQMVRSQLVQSERLALVGRLLASVSHELNNPLQAIQNALFLLKEEKDLSTQARQDLDVILAEAERMAALIERLRSAYRPVRMKDFQPVGMNSLIEDVHALISTHMRHKMITFEFLPDPELPHVPGLPDQLRQVVLNLFLNAIESMKPGGCLTVQTHSLLDGDEVLITVKDTGPGIDSEILPHIFDAFITTKHTGTGLGLTITHDIIQQHDGRITAENDPDGGAVFSVWLPVDKRGDQ